MKYLRIISILCFAATIFFFCVTSCRKDKAAVPADTVSLDQFFQDNLEDYRQQHTFNAETGTVIYAEYGTMIIVDSSSFVHQNGHPVTGLIDLELIELITKDAMLASNMPTVSNGKILFSGGQVFLEATQYGEPLRLASGKSLTMRVPMTSYTTYEDTALSLFYGIPDEAGVNWVAGDSIGENSILVFNIGPESASLDFNFSTPDLGWINCDYFPDGPSTDITISLPNGLSVEDLITFAYFKGVNALGVLSANSAGGFTGGNYPIGHDITVIALYEANGKVYSSFDDVQIVDGLEVQVNPQETTIEQLESDFWSLDD